MNLNSIFVDQYQDIQNNIKRIMELLYNIKVVLKFISYKIYVDNNLQKNCIEMCIP